VSLQAGGRWLFVGILGASLLVLLAWSGDVVRADVSTVSIMNFAFNPPSTTVHVGDTVTWTNNDSFIAHTTTSSAALWDSGALSTGQGFSFTFTSPGTFAYHCNIHPFMAGTITVLDSGATSTFTPTPTATPQPPASGQRVQLAVSKAGTNRLQVVVSAPAGQTLDRLAWTLPANAAAETLGGAALPTGIALPPGTTSTTFILRRVGGQSVTLPIVVTGSFGTWRTFVGGGPSAW
jgi:plastocyanin